MAWAVFGIIFAANGEAAGGLRMTFRRADRRARPIPAGVIAAGDVTTTTAAPSGFFRVTLTPGRHYLWIGSSERISIVVPDLEGEYLLPDLLGVAGTPVELAFNYRTSNGVRQLINSSTGGFHSINVIGLPNERRFGFSAAGVGEGAVNFRYRAGMLELADFGNSTWHAPFLQSGGLFIAPDGSEPTTVDRIQAGVWQIRDQATDKFRSWWISGGPGAETLSFGPETP